MQFIGAQAPIREMLFSVLSHPILSGLALLLGTNPEAGSRLYGPLRAAAVFFMKCDHSGLFVAISSDSGILYNLVI